ncbi:mitochondrial 2-oxoglutarate/malate carrier protein-like isoform X2 [Condylostylus longicornis]|nr:mitochondrial 2-oxoglutarate/malate carrier protein-like isoform X2 [Condylostylus longicornis]
MQTQGEKKIYKSSIDCFRKVITKEGILGIYTGLDAALLRQLTYTGGRFGTYKYLEETYKNQYGTKPGYASRLFMGMIAGAVGSFLGTPTEIILIRMTADGRLPIEEQRNYRNVFHAFKRIIQEEGALTLFRGAAPTINRGIIVNMVQLGTYYQTKEFLTENLNIPESRFLHFCCGLLCGFLSAFVTAPMDFAKTRIQDMATVTDKPLYKGTVDVIYKVTRREGFLTVYTGFMPYFLRIGPRNVFTFMFLEELTNLYLNYLK